MNLLTWIGIFICLSQSALLSGKNLGLFSLSKLELNVAARKGDQNARKILKYRRDTNFTLMTILWAKKFSRYISFKYFPRFKITQPNQSTPQADN
jgi:CBS domain containing-hemolysin-like protein